jgi:hypothetical protein
VGHERWMIFTSSNRSCQATVARRQRGTFQRDDELPRMCHELDGKEHRGPIVQLMDLSCRNRVR